jgi:predicted metal-dependent phosphoesterase TrpH
MLRLEGENIFSIGAGLEIKELLKKFEEFELREDELKLYLKKLDNYAYREISIIDFHQDKIIAQVLELAIKIIAENQLSNRLIDNYDPVHMRAVLMEKRKRKKNQRELFQNERSELNVKKNRRPMERTYHKIPNQNHRYSTGRSETYIPR